MAKWLIRPVKLNNNVGAMTSTQIFGHGLYGSGEALELINFPAARSGQPMRKLSRHTVARWLRGYDVVIDGRLRNFAPLWIPDYANDDGPIEISFRDLIEIRFVKAFRDAGVSLQAIRQCFERAVEVVQDNRPFSSGKFRTDGRTIFLQITQDLDDDVLIDLRHRQSVFRTFVEPSFRDLEFDADMVTRWFPLGDRRSVLIAPDFALGRPITVSGHVPTEVLAMAARVEGSVEKAARAYEVSSTAVRDAIEFQALLAA